MKEQLYRVWWISKLTNAWGCGEPLLKNIARKWAKVGNDSYPDLIHWVEWYKEPAT